MRCSCRVCDEEAYMVHAESERLGCVCPACGARCTDCLGTGGALTHEAVLAMKRAAQGSRDDAREQKG